MRRRFIQKGLELIEVPVDYVSQQRSAAIWSDIPDYTSPIDGSLVSGRRQRREDLKRHGCRPWEGREQESREANRQRGYLQEKIDRSLERCANESFYQLPPDKRRLLTR